MWLTLSILPQKRFLSRPFVRAIYWRQAAGIAGGLSIKTDDHGDA
jgi:hypothetical protein